MRPALLVTVVGALLGGAAIAYQVEDGKQAYKMRCAMCHGDDGTGNPAIARLMKVEFKSMASDYVQMKSDDEMVEIVTQGKGKMVPVRGLTEDQILQIIAYIRTLKPEPEGS